MWLNFKHRYSPVLVRLANSILALWLVTILFFAMTEFAVWDFAIASATQFTTQEDILALKQELGLFLAPTVRYLQWLANALQGDLGTSWWLRHPVTDLIFHRLGNSLWLVLWAVVIAVPVALLLSLATASWQKPWLDRFLAVTTLGMLAVPEFLLACILMFVGGIYLDWVPVITWFEPDMSILERLHASALPIISLQFVVVVPIYRLSRAALNEVLKSDYIQMAELKGLPRGRILWRHALPNVVAPVSNIVVLTIANLFFGLVVIETMFAYPGLGYLLVKAAQLRDIPLIQGCALLSGLLIICLNFLADLLSVVLNPRLSQPAKPTLLTLPGWFSKGRGGMHAFKLTTPVAVMALLA